LSPNVDFSLDDFINVVKKEEFEEKPVSLEEFLYSEAFLNFPPLSDIQFKAIEAMTQIYRYETLVDLWGQEEADRLEKSTQKEIILMLGKGCIAPYEKIYDASTGLWQQVGDLHLSPEGRVASVNVDSRAVSADTRTESWPYGVGEMVRVKTSLGFTNDVYVGHKFLSWDSLSRFYKRNERDNSPIFRAVKDLSVGDRIGIAARLPNENPVPQNSMEVELVGFWLGDGCMPTDKIKYLNVDFNVYEENSLARYIEILEKLDIKYRVKNYDDKKMVSVISPGYAVEDIVRKYGMWGKRAGDKVIPEQIKRLPEDQIALFLSRLWGTDGCVYHKHNADNIIPVAEYTTISEELAVDLHRLLLRVGIPARLSDRIPTYTYMGKKKHGQRAYTLTVSSAQCFQRFADVVKLLDKQGIIDSGLKLIDYDNRNYRRIDGDIFWDRIVSIESLGEGEYWDLTVADNHNYVANGIVSSNSGKDLISSIAFARIAYLLLCLKDPARYYGKPPGDSIAMLNVAVNAQQAKNVFFRYFKQRIRLCPWFNGKWDETADALRFDKNIFAYSGHSEREAWEGYNFIVVVLDEISAFATEAEGTSDGLVRDKSADSIYNMYKTSVSSRFPQNGKIVLLSFPRYKDDFIDKRYNDVVAQKTTEVKSHTFKVHDDLPDNLEDNIFTVEWEDDTIMSYREPGVFALKKPTWEVNPTITIEDLKQEFLRSPSNALTRFACMPRKATDAFFKDKDKLMVAFPEHIPGPFRDDWSWHSSFKPKKKNYYLHVDLAYSHDRAAVAIASVDDWVTIKYSESMKYVVPVVSVDAVRFWTPSTEQNIDLEEVKNFIVELKMAGFKIKLVTFDRWNSLSYREQLKKDFSIDTEVLSVAKPHYEDFALALMEERVRGYNLPLLVEEMLGLRIIKGNKVDHQRKGSKDVSDAVVGAIYNVINHEKSSNDLAEVEAYFGSPEEEEKIKPKAVEPKKNLKMPKGLADFISERAAEPEEKKKPAAAKKNLFVPVDEVDLSVYFDGERVV